MDRRSFFRRAAGKTTELAVGEAQRRARARLRWLRPPYAADELEFLLACTRCGACVEACPQGVIFALPPRLGAQVMGTPALDLTWRGCQMCADWPCVAACEPGALALPEVSEPGEYPLPRLASVQVDPDACLPYGGPECGACRDSCPVPGAMRWEMERPTVDPLTCVGCALCREACIVEPKAITVARRNPEERVGK
ncbi:MAG: hypothetical protein GWO16_11740 [Gammaproteobacteria bacterium]|nr:hypothetical protein [Gammaproteobacteria bacterium]NIR98600.1 hypothetical protein [Gammaproteobacteria bacterium]NIT64323.1 hypothetical protein [Gammaproteobacteria bacterium]NIV21247.1 hypothetical protein [Gammaproteobacteria bacterium]NIX10951.1 hypothetical protein [Gammaproteobacteria bacterium]